jgi:hypothetical protein
VSQFTVEELLYIYNAGEPEKVAGALLDALETIQALRKEVIG